MIVDSYKLAHWMNVRKVTPADVAETADLDEELVRELLQRDRPTLADDRADRLAGALRVSGNQLAASPRQGLTAVVNSPEELRASRRPIQRDGITFYNYYSMAGPPGRVAPVILDILCPHDRLPALNNGHLEPAITVNLGPGDIHGRWGEELGKAEWQVLRANRAEDSWIVGDSYVEPSYCPHSYSLASEEPARIISYTCESNLAPLFSELNDWGDPAFGALLRDVGDAAPPDLLRSALLRRGFEPHAAAERSGVARDALEAFLEGDTAALSTAALRALGDAVGFDYRTLLRAPRRHDAVGKTSRSIEESRASVRAFRSYTVASMASAAHLPDLIGLFLSVAKPGEPRPELDLCESSESHYLVVGGEPTLAWREVDGSVAEATLEPDASAWVAPYVDHGFGGEGAIVKLGSGSHVGYLDQIELSNTFDGAATLRRGRRDALGWGYDTGEARRTQPAERVR